MAARAGGYANARELCEEMLRDDYLPTVIGPGVPGRLCELFDEHDSHEQWMTRDEFAAKFDDLIGPASPRRSPLELALERNQADFRAFREKLARNAPEDYARPSAGARCARAADAARARALRRGGRRRRRIPTEELDGRAALGA